MNQVQDTYDADKAMERLLGPCTEECKRLQELAGGMLLLRCDKTEFVGDPDSRGHLITGWLNDGNDEGDIITLDDRKPDLPGQLAAELRRVAKVYHDLADQVADTLSPVGELAGSGLFRVLLIDSGQAKVVYQCDSRSEANAWVEEWDLEPLGMVALVWPSWAPHDHGRNEPGL